MKTTVNFSYFVDAFKNLGRENNFTNEGLELLFDYLEEIEQSTGEEIELDVISLCCEYDENDVDDIISSYDIDAEGLDDDEKCEAVRDYLENKTCLVGETSTGFVYAAF